MKQAYMLRVRHTYIMKAIRDFTEGMYGGFEQREQEAAQTDAYQ